MWITSSITNTCMRTVYAQTYAYARLITEPRGPLKKTFFFFFLNTVDLSEDFHCNLWSNCKLRLNSEVTGFELNCSTKGQLRICTRTVYLSERTLQLKRFRDFSFFLCSRTSRTQNTFFPKTILSYCYTD